MKNQADDTGLLPFVILTSVFCEDTFLLRFATSTETIGINKPDMFSQASSIGNRKSGQTFRRRIWNIQIFTIYNKLEYGKYMQYMQSSSFACFAGSGKQRLLGQKPTYVRKHRFISYMLSFRAVQSSYAFLFPAYLSGNACIALLYCHYMSF